MGVPGLWRVLQPAGRTTHLDGLRGRVLAVDISIWLHQMVKGYQDASGRAVANAHLLGLFQRLCKLLYYGIKPIFVFDGSIPALKRNTIQNRQMKRSHMKNDADQVQQKLLSIITKNAAVNSLLANKIPSTRKSPVKAANLSGDEDLFKLPDLKAGALESSSSESEDESLSQKSASSKYQNIDLHGINVQSEDFKKLSARERHDILTDLKETRKQNSWGRIHELPAQSDNFSDYQMNRLLKRRQVQVSLEEAEKEIGGHFLSINELEILLNEEGISTKIDNIRTRQIASDENAHFLLIKDVKKAMSDAIQHENTKNELEKCVDAETPSTSGVSNVIEDYSLEDELDSDIKKAIALSLEGLKKEESDDIIEIEDNVNWNLIKEESFNESDDDEPKSKQHASHANRLAIARGYMMEFSGLTENEINQIINNEVTKSKKVIKKDNNLSKSSEKNILNPSIIVEENINSLSKSNERIILNSSPIIIEENINNLSKSNERIILNSSPIIVEESKNNLIMNEVVPDVIKSDEIQTIDESSTDSDSSFEEVPEVNKSDDRLKNYSADEDIFADVFKDQSKFVMLDDAVISTLNKNTVNIADDNKIDLTEEIKDTSPPELAIVESAKNVNSNNDVTSASFEEDLFEEEDVSPNASEAENNLELSPRKGMPLNNIKLLASNRSREDDNIAKGINDSFSIEMVTAMAEDLDNQRTILEKEKNKLDRMGRNISDEMSKDAQELLKLFGIPYIVAPTEAESQCAYLESINLTDGTITDDSDIWLFGGKTVYRNFFNQQKQVLQFLADNIKSSFRLQREDFILLSLLVGSDYTMGVSGIGPVTALEILSAFPTNKSDVTPPYTTLLNGLKRFKNWWSTKGVFTHTSLRNKLKNISLTEEFPNHKVVEAYLLPDVDKSTENFSWGKFDIGGLREFTTEKFGWTRAKTEEILNPILKRMNIQISQLSIRSFFDTEFKKDVTIEKMSKRVQKAIENMDTGEKDEDSTDKIVQKKGGRQSKKKNDSAPKKLTKAQQAKANKITNDESLKSTENENVDVNPTEETATDGIQLKKGKKNQGTDLKTAAKGKKRKIESVDDITEKKESDLLLHMSAHCTDEMSLGETSASPFFREKIPQREHDKGVFLKNKLKAIELFRTSKKGPGFVKRRKKNIIQPKEDAELSESSSD